MYSPKSTILPTHTKQNDAFVHFHICGICNNKIILVRHSFCVELLFV